MRLLLLLPILMAQFCNAQFFTDSDIELVSRTIDTLKKYHVDYQTVSVDISNRFPLTYIHHLDPEGVYFTHPETEELINDFEQFNQEEANILKVLRSAKTNFQFKVNRKIEWLQELPRTDFYVYDTLTLWLSEQKVNYVDDERSLKELWLKNLKYAVLSRFDNKTVTNKDLSSIELNVQLNQALREEVESLTCTLEQFQDETILRDYILHNLIQAYCQSFDPHTVFIPYLDSDEIFEDESLDEFFGTGIFYEEEDNNFIVDEIILQSPASFFETIEVGDVISKIMIDGVLVSPHCVDKSMLEEQFYGYGTDTLEIEIQSLKDKKLRKFKIHKSSFKIPEDHVYAFIINDNTGYVLFSNFYGLEMGYEQSSAQDLARKLLELNRKGVDDVIIDLRGNSGGSVIEAIDLLSYFIDYGPLFTLTTTEDEDPFLVKEMTRGKAIKGKTIFLVDASSASASEVVASTMQFYPESLVVGSRTYGKSTGQDMILIDGDSPEELLALLLVTSLKVNNFDGSTYQGRGVIPDILIPTSIPHSLDGEDSMPYVLTNPPTKKYRSVIARKEPIDSLKARVERRANLMSVQKVSNILESLTLKPIHVALRYSDFNSELIALPIDTTLAKIMKLTLLESNEAFIPLGEAIQETLETDSILYESTLILKDWIELDN